MKFKILMCFKNTDPDPDLKIKISGSGFGLDGSKILLSRFGSIYPGYTIFGADLGSNPDLG